MYSLLQLLKLSSTFYLNLVVGGYVFVFGYLKLYLEQQYPDYPAATIAIIGGVVPGSYLLFAPLCLAITEHSGPCSVIIFASCLSVFGFVLAWANFWLPTGTALAYSIDFLGLGVFQGISSALLYGPSIAVIRDHFPQNQRHFATGVTTCGTSIGIVIYGTMFYPLADRFGWRYALLFLGLFSLIGVLCGFPFMWPNEGELKKSRPNANESDFEDGSLIDNVVNSGNEGRKSTFCETFKRYRSTKLLRTTLSFKLLLLAAITSINGYYVPTTLLPGHSKNPIYNVSPFMQKSILWMFGAANTVGRVVTGQLADLGHKRLIFSSFSLFIFGQITASIACFVFPSVMANGDAVFATFVICCGVFLSPMVTCRSVIVSDLYGEKETKASFGWMLMVQVTVVGGYLLPAHLNELNNSYPYYYAATFFVLSALLVCACAKPFFEGMEARKKEQNCYPQNDNTIVS